MGVQAGTKRQRAGLAPLRGAADADQRVLVVDDDEYIRHLLASALRFAGFVVDTSEDGRTAIDRIGDFRPDLVLLDVMMPGLDGLEVCRRMRASGNETPVVFLTARDSSED